MYIRANNRTSWEKHATAEQITIYEWCRTNLPEACLHKCGYFAYNDDIVQDMKTKVHPLCECRTAHGWGASVLKSHYGYLQPHKGKSRSIGIVQQLTGTALNDMNNKEKFKWLSTINHFEKLKEELLELTFENFQLVHSKYDSLAQYQVFPEIADLPRSRG